MNQALVKFHGNALVVPHESLMYKVAQEELIKVTNELQKVSSGTWETTGSGLKGLVQNMSDPHSKIQQYQIDLIREVLVPYLRKQNGRYFTDQARVRQLNEIIFALSLHGKQHPAISLNMLEKIKTEIQSNQSYLWKSELLTVLETSLAKQWLPIVVDTKQFLIDTSGKLFVLGMIGTIGWPIAFVSPIMYSSKKLMKAMDEWDRRKQFSQDNIIELVKVAFMIILLMQLVTILQFYAALGQLFLVGSVVSFLIAQSDTTVKELSPMLAPQAYLIDQFFVHVSRGDMKSAIRVVSSGPPIFAEEESSRQQSSEGGVTIEVLDDEDDTPKPTPSSSSAYNKTSNPATKTSSSTTYTASSSIVIGNSGTGNRSYASSTSSVHVEEVNEEEEEEKKSTTTTTSTVQPTSTPSSPSSGQKKSIFDTEGLRKRRFLRGLI